MTPNRAGRSGRYLDGIPDLRRLRRHIIEEVAVNGQDGEAHILDHAIDDARLDHPDNRNVRRDGGKVDMIDPGSGGEQHLQPG